MEHTVYLAAKAFIEEISPCLPKNKDSTDTIEDEDDDWTVDLTYLEELLDDEEVHEAIEYLPGDVLGKALALVNQVFWLFSSLLLMVANLFFRSDSLHKPGYILA